MFVVIKTQGRQFKVAKGDKITVDNLEGEVGSIITFPEVLLYSDDKETVLGTPTLKNVVVEGKIAKQYKGEKLIVYHKKPKKRQEVKRGFRRTLTDIVIEKIEKK